MLERSLGAGVIRGHGWADVLHAACLANDLTIVYPFEPDESTRKLMDTLGVKVAVIKPREDMHEANT